MDELLAEFIAETRETLAPLAGEVVAWEAEPKDRARLDTIFRFVHTVKGSCGFLDLPRLEQLSHSAEGALAEVRAGRRVADGALVSAVLAIIDRIGEMVEALDAGEVFPEGGDEALMLALEEGAAAAPAPATSAATPAPATAPAVARTAARSIRLPVELLDRLMAGVSDMVLARNELSRRLRDIDAPVPVDTAFERLSACIAEMREAITRTRMQRIEGLFTALPRMVRDLSADLGKPVALVVEGQDVELDREMIEMIRDPLTHIVRNAIDHGLEPAEDRVRGGKPATGTLRVSARQAGNQILIDIADDGRGVSAERLAAKAVVAGLMSAEEAAALPVPKKLALMFEPGLSTASVVTAVSGRGVGMDVVRANIERIGGVVEIDSRPQQGTRFTLRVPLTLTIIPALTISVGDQQFAVPRAAIEEIVRADRGVVMERVGGLAIVAVRGVRLPLVDLGELMTVPCTVPAAILVILKPAGGEAYALAVSGVHNHEELVVKPAAPAVMATGLYAGTTLPDTGRPMLLLDPAGLAQAAGVGLAGIAAEPAVAETMAEPLVPTLLFRDLDGAERAVRLALVERIEDVAATALCHVAGRWRLNHKDRLLPVIECGAGVDADPDGRPRRRVLLLSDGGSDVAYLIDQVIDIVALPPALVPADRPGPVAGVTLVDGRPVELLDAHWLFADALRAPPPATARPLCVLADEGDRWTREVLRPLVEAAGYRVGWQGAADEANAAVVIAIDQSGPAAAVEGTGAPLVRLRSRPEAAGTADHSIYRYDRTALLAALGAARASAA